MVGIPKKLMPEQLLRVVIRTTLNSVECNLVTMKNNIKNKDLAHVAMATAAVFSLGIFLPGAAGITINPDAWVTIPATFIAILATALVIESLAGKQPDFAALIRYASAIILGVVYGGMVSAMSAFLGYKEGRENMLMAMVLAIFTYVSCHLFAQRVYAKKHTK